MPDREFALHEKSTKVINLNQRKIQLVMNIKPRLNQRTTGKLRKKDEKEETEERSKCKYIFQKNTNAKTRKKNIARNSMNIRKAETKNKKEDN